MQAQTYETLLGVSKRVNWRIEDIIGGERSLDFTRPFLPETFARTAQLSFLSPAERLVLNHIRAHGYLAMFGLVEEFILPFVNNALATPSDDAFRGPALAQFAEEEVKHMELFRRFRREFAAGFGVECGFIGPVEDIRATLLAHEPLPLAIATLGIEWMSQGHYVESVRDDENLDPQFKSLLKHHWMEECQHARLDGLLLREMAQHSTPGQIARAVDAYFEIGAFLDGGLKAQAELDLDSFERATGRRLTIEERARFLSVQHQALRWTFLGSAMKNQNFVAALQTLGEGARRRVEDAAPMFC